MQKLETSFMVIFWNYILERLITSSKQHSVLKLEMIKYLKFIHHSLIYYLVQKPEIIFMNMKLKLKKYQRLPSIMLIQRDKKKNYTSMKNRTN